jgi:hypothetical protein
MDRLVIRIRRAPFFMLPLVIAVHGLAGQEVRGQVWDRIASRGVSQGVVTLVSTDGDILARGAVGPQGQYAFRAPAAGSYVVQFVGAGYGHTAREFTLAAAETRILRIEVTPLPQAELDTVVVEGRPVPRRLSGFYQRQATGLGEFITREQIEQWNPLVTTDILRRTQGVSVVRFADGVRVASRRDPTLCAGLRAGVQMGPLVFLDGAYLGAGTEVDIDALLAAQSIEAVEVYSGAAELPVEFNRLGADCGIVALWTRVGAAVEAAPYVRPVEIGPQAGAWVVSRGLQEGRVGARLTIGVSPTLEISAALNGIIEGFHSGSAGTNRRGTQFMLTPRARPLGDRSPWYVGAGFTHLSLEESAFRTVEEDHVLVVTGLSLRTGRARPFAEIQVLSPFDPGDAQIHLSAGVAIRVY